MSKTGFHHALKIDKELCIGCTHCMKVCPTKALRVKDGVAILDDSRCVDCGECYRNCPVNAIYIEQDDFDRIFDYKHKVILLPSVFLGQFPENISIAEIHGSLMELGFNHIYEVEHSYEIIKETTRNFIENTEKRPLISPFCPAVVRLIQVRFPELTENIIPIKPPLEISALYYKKKLIDRGINEKDIGIFYVTPCAAKISAVKCPVGNETSPIDGVINLDFLYNKVRMSMENDAKPAPVKEILDEKALKWTLTNGENDNIEAHGIAIDEIHNVIRFLERLENEDIPPVDFLELRACDESCAGGALSFTNRFLISERLKNRCKFLDKEPQIQDSKHINDYNHYLLENCRLKDPIEPRSIIQLDNDRIKALEKMQKVQEIYEQLPKIDCGSCGAPTCKTLARDIVMEKAEISDCIFLNRAIKNNNNVKKIWGYKKFNYKNNDNK